MIRLLPLTVNRAVIGTLTLRLKPSSRTRSSRWVSAWHSSSLSTSLLQLSNETMVLPLSSSAPRRFSVSSLFEPCEMTGVISPLASSEARSTSSDLPVPATGEVKACSGAVAMAWRSSAVSTRLSATERSTFSTKGNSSSSVSSR